MWQNTWQLKEKRRQSSDRLPRKSGPSNAYVERAHQSVEAMVRTMKEEIEDKAKIKLSATADITTSMIRHAAFMQTRFSVGMDGKTPFKRLSPLDQLSMRRSETKRLNAANSIPDSFQVFGLEEPQRATNTSSEQHWAYTQQGRFEQKMIQKSGTVVSSRV